jgi:hypothetical protein
MQAPDAPIGLEVEGPGRRYFDDVVLDNVLEAMLELTAAVWTYRDRAIVLERVLDKLLADSHGAGTLERLIEEHRPTRQEREARRAEREALATQVFRSFARRPTMDAAPLGAGRRADMDDAPREASA